MATARRMPTNIDVLDALTEKVAQEGNTTVIGGNLEVDGKLQANQPVTVNAGSSLTEGYHVERTTTSYDYDTIYASSKVIINQKNKNGTIRSTREFSFPSKGGTIVAGLYRHVIKGQTLNGSWGGGTTIFMLTVISSNNLKVTSLTNLKTLLGNTFEYPATGYYEGNMTSIWKINESVATDSEGTNFGLNEFTFTDTVTSV